MNKKANVMTEEAKERLLAQHLRTAGGRNEIGQSIMEPFKVGRDYVSIGRKIMFVDMLPTAAPMWYDKDPQFSAVTIGKRGAVPYEIIEGERVELEPIPIVTYVRIPVLDVSVRRFNILDREQVRARAEMAEIEDSKVFAAIDYGATTATGHNDAVTATAGVARDKLADLFSKIEDHDAPVANVLMRAAQYKDLRGWDNSDFDPVTQREVLKTGYVGDLWGAQVRVSKKITAGKVYATADPDFLGVISVRIDLDQMDAPDPQFLQLGWVFYEYIGVAQIIAQGSAVMNVTYA